MKTAKVGAAIAGAFCGACLLGSSAFAEAYTIQMEDADLYNALKTCASEGVDEDTFDNADFTERMEMLHCELEGATFNDDGMTISFESEDAAMDATTFSLPRMGIKHVKDFLKFPNFSFGNLIHNEIEDAQEISDLITTFNLSPDGAILIADNKLTSFPTEALDAVFEDDDFMWTMVYFGMYASSQILEDSYDGGTYTLPQGFADVQRAFAELREKIAGMDTNNMDDESIARLEALYEFYDIANWLKLENATLSEDGKTLTPIDPTKDMRIAYERSWDDMAMNPLYNGCYDGSCSDDELADELEWIDSFYLEVFRVFHDDDDMASVIALTVKAPETLNPDTVDNAALYVALGALATVATGGVLLAAKNRR